MRLNELIVVTLLILLSTVVVASSSIEIDKKPRNSTEMSLKSVLWAVLAPLVI